MDLKKEKKKEMLACMRVWIVFQEKRTLQSYGVSVCRMCLVLGMPEKILHAGSNYVEENNSFKFRTFLNLKY